MNGRWWKAPENAFLDRRLQKLPAGLFRFWFNLQCVASWSGGRLPPIADIAFLLRSSVAVVTRRLAALQDAGLVDMSEDEPRLVSCEGRQDAPAEPVSGAARTKRWRDRRETTAACDAARDEAVTGVTPPEREEQKDKKDSARDARGKCDGFEEFWRAFPKREGDNPEAPARSAYHRAIAQGAQPALLVAAAHAYAAVTASRERKFIASAARWLSEGRWKDAAQKPEPKPNAEPPGAWIKAGTPEWRAWADHYRETKGKGPPVDAKGGWRFPSLSPSPRGITA